MRMFNADGSEAEMCGNGVRCVAKFAYDHGLSTKRELRVETGDGIKTLQLFLGAAGKVDRVRVDMGQPRLLRGEIPMTGPADAGWWTRNWWSMATPSASPASRWATPTA